MNFQFPEIGPEVILALQVLVALLGAYFVALWLSLALWTYQDIRSRSRDYFAQFLAVILVLVFNLPGLMLYLILRPHETLADGYERSLHEEALLQDMDELLACPTCKNRVESAYILCPSCRTRLKKACPQCSHALKLDWDTCPYCGHSAEEDITTARLS